MKMTLGIITNRRPRCQQHTPPDVIDIFFRQSTFQNAPRLRASRGVTPSPASLRHSIRSGAETKEKSELEAERILKVERLRKLWLCNYYLVIEQRT